MKLKYWDAVLFFALFYIAIYNNRTLEYKHHNQEVQIMSELGDRLDKRDYLDSLYYDHLKDCSMIDSENIGVGYRGTLYSKYHRHEGRFATK